MKKGRIVTILICITLLMASIFVLSACEIGDLDPNGDNSDTQTVTVSYTAAYSMPKTTDIIQGTITGKLEAIFKEQLPDLETKDFFKLEIASGGIMRGFMSVPCNMWFTMKQKIEAFLECTFKLYDVPKEKITEAIEFVSKFDFEKIAQETVNNMLKQLEESRTTVG